MLNRRCTQRQFLLRPDDEMNNAFLYCLIEAAQKFDIVLLLSQMMSNHQHTPFFDPKGLAIEFTHRFHTHLAKCVNAHRGRWGNMWSTEPSCLVELVDADDVVDKLIYTASNPVKDGLVEKVHHWPGPKTVHALLEGRTLKATRPRFLFRDDGPMPDEVEMTLAIPKEVGDHDEIIARVRAGIAAVEDECARERAKNNRRILGRRRVLRQSCATAPRLTNRDADSARASPRVASGRGSKRCRGTRSSRSTTAKPVRAGYPEHR